MGKTFDFYEFAGLIVPGVLLQVGIGALWPKSAVSDILLPTSVAGALVNIVSAYAVGHLIQAVANIVESLYWSFWGGLPTDWIITRPKRAVRPGAVEDAIRVSRFKGKVMDVKEWHSILASARAKVYDSQKDNRISVFNGNYSLFRGICVCGLVFISSVWASAYSQPVLYAVLVVITGLSVYHMHHFAVLYARELHACIANIANEEG